MGVSAAAVRMAIILTVRVLVSTAMRVSMTFAVGVLVITMLMPVAVTIHILLLVVDIVLNYSLQIAKHGKRFQLSFFVLIRLSKWLQKLL